MTIDLDLAYLIRADAIAFVAANAGRDMVPGDAIVREMMRLHPSLTHADATHLEERVAACWGQPGLDHEEAPARHDGLREWYPVRRNGRLQRTPLPALTEQERAEIVAEMRGQSEWALARGAELRATP